jgi:membrane-associated protein
MLAWLDALAASAWLIPALLLLCAVDGVVPVVPGETAAITAGVLATTGRPALTTVMIAAAGGSFIGDCVCYAIWRRFGSAMSARIRPGTRHAATLAWAGDLLHRRGGPVILVARFVPSLRAAASLTAGTTAFPLRRFLAWSALAASGWGIYISLLGYLGGRVTDGNPLYGVLIGLGFASAVTVVLSVVRRCRSAASDCTAVEGSATPNDHGAVATAAR